VQHLRRFLLVLTFTLGLTVPKLTAENTCPVTTLPNPSFVPPAPYRSNAAQGAFWYGTGSLWTQLPNEGVWRGLPRRDNSGYFNKLFLWQQGYNGRSEPEPDIIVVLRRLDATVPLVSQRGGTNAFFDNTWAMLTGVLFPAEGCWEVTTHHDGHTLTFVLSIQP
jgi:hypothetical protein